MLPLRSQNGILSVVAVRSGYLRLENLLVSIQNAKLPVSYRGIMIVENGPNPIWGHLEKENKFSFPIIYRYFPEANKSNALNSVLPELKSQMIYFHDADVEVGPDALLHLEQTIQNTYGRYYFGGPVKSKPETTISSHLMPLMPSSVTGFDLPTSHFKRTYSNGKFLGGNWAAFGADLMAVGGFDKDLGPSHLPVGEDSDIQFKLNQRGFQGIYLSNCLAFHWVARENSTPEWLLHRNYRHGLSAANLALKKRRLFQGLIFRFRPFFSGVPRRSFFRQPKEIINFKIRFWISGLRGYCVGLKGVFKSIGILGFIREFNCEVLDRMRVFTVYRKFRIVLVALFKRQWEFTLALGLSLKFSKPALPISIYTTSSCALNCDNCIMMNLMKKDSAYHMSLETLKAFISESEKNNYLFDVILTGGEPLAWKHFESGVRLLKASKAVRSLTVFTNALSARRVTPDVMKHLDAIRISQYNENGEKMEFLLETFPDKTSVVPRDEFWVNPTIKYKNVLPAECLNPEIFLYKDRIYACPHSESIAIGRGSRLELSKPIEKRFLRGLWKIKLNQQKEICAYCISNNKVRKQSPKAPTGKSY